MESGLVAEALRINLRYVTEVVEAFDICPFARQARLSGALERRVLLDPTPSLEPALAAIAALEARVEVSILIYPRLAVSSAELDAFVASLRRALGPGAPFVLAPFHPEAPYSRGSARQLVPLFRRAPDPTIQVVRFAVLEAMRGDAGGKFLFEFSARGLAELARRSGTISISDRITQANHERILQEGAAVLEAIYDDIRADRDRAYAPFAEAPR